MIYETQILKNYINLVNIETINFYIKQHLKNPSMTNNAGWATYYTVGKEVEDIINSILPKFDTESLNIHYYVSTGVSGPHCDKGWIKGGRTFIVPLEKSISYTIVFNQMQDREIDNDIFFKDAPILNIPISEEYSHLNLNHVNTNLKKLSIEKAFFWGVGDILIFDRKKIHCSDYFLTVNSDPKKALVIWSEIS